MNRPIDPAGYDRALAQVRRDAAGNVVPLLNLPAHLSGLETLEQLASLETLNPIFRAACKREVTRAHARRREHESRQGVRVSGMDPDPYAIRSVDDIAAEAEALEAKLASPRFRFLQELAGAAEHDPVTAEEVRGIWNRDLADERQPLNHSAVAAAIILLLDIPGKHARAAIEALAELQLQANRKAA